MWCLSLELRLKGALPLIYPTAMFTLISPLLLFSLLDLLGDFLHRSEYLRPLAFALWPSNSYLSSAVASPQFSAAGSTPSH